MHHHNQSWFSIVESNNLGSDQESLRAVLCMLRNATTIGGDANRFKHIEGRFASPVFPGEALTIKMWETSKGEAVFTTSVGDRIVIDQGLVRFS